MPDAALYLKAALAAAGASIFCALAVACWRRPAAAARSNLAGVLGVGLGLAAGYALLQPRPAWPPVNALERYLLIVLPAVLLVELLAGFERVPRWVAWLLRSAAAAAAGPALLYGSIYVAGPKPAWAPWQSGIIFTAAAGLLVAAWKGLIWLSQRGRSAATPLALSMATLCGGMAIMLAGYIGGGAAAFPLAAALAGAAIAALASGKDATSQGTVGIGVVGLFGLLVIGRFFGELASGAALTIFLSPLLCLASEAPLHRTRSSSLKAAIGLLLTAIPLVLVLLAAKVKFDQEMAPLLR